MNDQQKRLLLALLPALVPPTPDHTQHSMEFIANLMIIVNLPPSPSTDIRFRHFSEDGTLHEGRDVFTMFAENRYQFYQLTGETPETLIHLQNLISLQPDRDHLLSVRNRTLMFVLWLRTYPTYHTLATMFGISVSTVSSDIRNLIPIFFETLQHLVDWPAVAEWREMAGGWTKLPMAVGAIDGTSHRIYRPEIEPQEQYYSGHRCFHCVHTQVVVDVQGRIRHIESGYSGRLNDAQQFRLMQQIGTELPFPEELLLLGDKIYPNRGSIMTPYTSAQLRRKSPTERRKCRKLNRFVRKYRVRVEHAISEIKTYKSVGTLWRHPRNLLPQIVFICASLVCRRKQK